MAAVVLDPTHAGGSLLERDTPLAVLHEALTESRLGRGRVILVAGEAGAGKTSLLRAFFARCNAETRLFIGSCDPLSTPRPLGPFIDLAGSEGALADVVRLGAPPSDVFDALQGELREGPAVLAIEDLHWADEATLDVLRLLCRRIETLPALVIATLRDDELTQAHPLRVFRGDLATVGAVGRLAIEPLSRTAVGELARGSPVDAEELYLRTGGNPFFVHQVLEGGGADVPATVRDAVLARAARLRTAASELLEVIALMPAGAEPWLLETVAGDAGDGLENCLDSCLATGLVTVGDRVVTFRHELARLAVAAAVGLPRREILHRRIGQALADPPHGSADAARIAHHAEAANDAAAVLSYAPVAAREAAAAGAYREAAAQYARGLRFADGLATGAQAELLEAQSLACYLADDQLEAIAVLSRAIELRRAQGAKLRQARALAELSSYLCCRGLITEANDAVREAVELARDQPEAAESAAVQFAAARMRLIAGDLDAGHELARTAMDVARRAGDAETAGEASVTLGSIALQRDVDAGTSMLLRAAAEGRAEGRPQQAARALNNLGGYGASACRHEIANAYLPAALEYCTEQNLDLWRINVLALCARSALNQGRWAEAAEHAERLLHDPRESPWPHLEALLVLALVRSRRGDPEAEAAIDAAIALDIPADERDAIVDLAAARAEVAWLEGRAEDIDAATGEVLDLARARGAGAAVSRLSFWRHLAGLDVDVLEGEADPYALGVAGAWERAAEGWTRLGCPYEAALALAQTGNEAALRQALADLHALGAGPARQLVMRRLRKLGVRDVRQGPRKKTREHPVGLTPREAEVLALVADGERNADIARRLFVSHRTVGHHVSAILRKLEVESRGEAVAKARRLGLVETA
jgi:DNA-binding CsgD family transcriptional regulator/tetratricopeptide (TPR) repeat protein